MNKETVIYKKGVNYSIAADIYTPLEGKNFPVILFIHGGGLILGSRKDIVEKQLELYIKSGYAVVSIDYRLAPETKLQYIIDDVKDAIEWVKLNSKDFNINGDRIAVVGSSAGGYLALTSGTFDTKAKAIVSIYGYGDILGDWLEIPSENYNEMQEIPKEQAYDSLSRDIPVEGDKSRALFYIYSRQEGIWCESVTGYEPENEKENIMSYCPLYNVKEDFPPTLLIHGDQDNDVPHEQSVLMSKELDEKGIKNKLIIVEKAGHFFDYNMISTKVKKVFESVIEFLNANV